MLIKLQMVIAFIKLLLNVNNLNMKNNQKKHNKITVDIKQNMRWVQEALDEYDSVPSQLTTLC